MSNGTNNRSHDKVGQTLIKAFTFLGAILGLGLFGLARAVLLLAESIGWVEPGTGLGPLYFWVLSGTVAGFVLGWVLVTLRRRI